MDEGCLAINKMGLTKGKFNIFWLRYLVQAIFVVITLVVGYNFHLFVKAIASGAVPADMIRPPSIEAWLPIGSLMSLTYFLKTGIANNIHPAGFVIFTLSVVTAIALKRGFCSWVCPIGTLQEFKHKFSKRITRRNLVPPALLDKALRSIKYILMFFFLYFIIAMSSENLRDFIYGEYNRIADVKMYLFFANISRLAFVIILVILHLSIVIKNFWCRYLCPYGALLCAVTFVSPMGIKRDDKKCIDCGKCDKWCPHQIIVSKTDHVDSEECTACYACIEACPVDDTLCYSTETGKMKTPVWVFAVIILIVFTLIPQIFNLAGYWQNEITNEEYVELYQKIPEIGHPGAQFVDE